METRQEPLRVYKNNYWASEIADLYFNHQLGYTSYAYNIPHHTDKGYDVLALNKQLIPYYILCYASPDPELVPIPIMENDEESRIIDSESDYVFWWHIGTDKVSVIGTDTLLTNFVDTEKYEKVNNILAQWVSTDDENWNDAFSKFTLSPRVAEKANHIYDFRVSRLPVEHRKVPQPLEIARVE